MVDILVGPANQKFRVHKAPLCSRAPVFQKMFNGVFKEATDQAASLPDDLLAAFNLFLEWLDASSVIQADINNTTIGPIFDRIKLYCFGDKYCLPNLMDCAISSIISHFERSKTWPSAIQVAYVFGNTASGSHLQSLIADLLHYIIRCYTNTGCWFAAVIADIMMCSKDLVQDVVFRMRAVDKQQSELPTYPLHSSKCTYHLLAKDVKCRFNDD